MAAVRILDDPAPWPACPVLDRSWPSRVDLKQQVIDAIAAPILAAGAVTEDERPWLLLCLDEVVVNAMLHGNEGDPTLLIRAAVAIDERTWTVVVADHGDGFDATAVPDPEDPDSLLLEHGRGIRIMLQWLDELTYYQRGTAVVLARHRPGAT
jgi:serine/threonine-protein kinase RsbW